MSSTHRFDARSWRIIKEFAGVYGILTTDELYAIGDIPIGQFNAILSKIDGYEFPLYITIAKWTRKPCFNWDKRWATLYYDTYHPGDVVEMRRLQMRLKMLPVDQLKHSSDFMPPINKAQITEKSTINEIDWLLGTQLTRETISAYYDAEFQIKTNFCKKIANHPKREAIYNGLKVGIATPTQVCACGRELPLTASWNEHFKSVRHCRTILENINMTTIERWWRETGESPPGFIRTNTGNWRHIIPADRKRGNPASLHPVLRTSEIDIVPYMCQKLSGWRNNTAHIVPGYIH